jgi:hypothetical protein
MTTQTLNGQIIGEAENAIRAVLDRLLAGTGTTFHQLVALNQTALVGGSIDRDQLTARMASGLKVSSSVADAAVDALTSAQLMEPVPGDAARVSLTSAGIEHQRQIRKGIDEISARLYGDLPADDLATAGRVLTIITARANEVLAS